MEGGSTTAESLAPLMPQGISCVCPESLEARNEATSLHLWRGNPGMLEDLETNGFSQIQAAEVPMILEPSVLLTSLRALLNYSFRYLKYHPIETKGHFMEARGGVLGPCIHRKVLEDNP